MEQCANKIEWSRESVKEVITKPHHVKYNTNEKFKWKSEENTETITNMRKKSKRKRGQT